LRIYGKGLTRSANKRVGNKAIALKQCRKVIIRDISILMGRHFGILATGVDYLTIDNLKIDTNRDGRDIDSCRKLHISNCSVNSPYEVQGRWYKGAGCGYVSGAVEYDRSVAAPSAWAAVRLKNGNAPISGNQHCYLRGVNRKGDASAIQILDEPGVPEDRDLQR
jgi:hypothetical protein